MDFLVVRQEGSHTVNRKVKHTTSTPSSPLAIASTVLYRDDADKVHVSALLKDKTLWMTQI